MQMIQPYQEEQVSLDVDYIYIMEVQQNVKSEKTYFLIIEENKKNVLFPMIGVYLTGMYIGQINRWRKILPRFSSLSKYKIQKIGHKSNYPEFLL
jgi:hypothetical protein